MRTRLWAAIASLAIVLAASGSGGTAAGPQAPAYGVVGPRDAQFLVRVDPVTLKPLAGGLSMPEDFVFGGRSPDGRSAVFFDYGRPVVRVVDLERLKTRGDATVAPAGWRVRAAAWLTADRVAVVAQKMRGSYGQIVDRREVVIVDPFARRAIARHQVPVGSALTASVSGGDKLVLLLGRGDARTRTAKIVVADSSGSVRTVDVDLGVSQGLRLPSLVVEPSGARAFLVAAGAPVFELDLNTLEATPHVVKAGTVFADSPLGSRRAVLLEGGKLAVTGHDGRREGGVEVSRPAGLAFVDTSTWQARLVDRDVSGISVSGDTVVGYGVRLVRIQREGRAAQKVVGIGLRAYGTDGTRRWQRFGTQPLSAQAFRESGLVYEQKLLPLGADRLFVVDLDDGRQLRSNAQSVYLLPDVPTARPVRAVTAAEALEVEGNGSEFQATVQPEVTRVFAVLVDGSERELAIENGAVSYRAATPHENAQTVQALAGDEIVASVSLRVDCGGSAGPCPAAAATDDPPVYAFVGELPAGGTTLTRVDPRTLAPVGSGLHLGEPYTPSFARSPDGAEVALAVGQKPLVRIVELASLKVSRTLHVGGASEEVRSLAWLGEHRLVAIVQRMSRPTRRYVRARAAVTIDTATGRVVARRSLNKKLAMGGVGVGGGRLVVLLRSSSNKGSTVELGVVAADGSVRTRALEVGKTRGVLNTTALAVEPSGGRAFVLGWAVRRPTPPVLEIDLDTLATTRRAIRAPSGPLAAATLSTLRVGAFDDRFLVTLGAVGATERPQGMLMSAAGIFVLDTETWSANLLDPRASYFQTSPGRIFTYGPSSHPADLGGGPRGSGVSVYEPPSRRLFHLYERRPFQQIELAGDYAHILLGAERTKRLVFDARAGKPLGMLPALREPIQILPPVTPAVSPRKPSAAAAPRPGDPFSRVTNRGTPVQPKASKPGERELVPRDLFLLRRDQSRAVYRIGGLKPGINTCYASGPGNDVGRVGTIACGRSAFPSRGTPIYDMSSVGQVVGAKEARLHQLGGVAADAIAEIGLTDPHGNVIKRVPVRDNVYLLATPPAATTGSFVAYDSRGQIVFRSDQPRPTPAVPPTANPRRIAGYRLRITLPKGWSGEIRSPGAGTARAALFAGNRLPARDPRSTWLALIERDPRTRPAFRRIAQPPQLTPTDVRVVNGRGQFDRRFTLNGRQFTLQIGFGRSRPSAAQLGEINRALATLYVGAIAVRPTAAGTPLQRGSDDGVTVDVFRSGIVVFHFDPTSRLYKQLRGTRISVDCLTFDAVSPWEPNQTGFSNQQVARTLQVIFSEATSPRPPYATLDPATEARPPFDGCLVSGSYGRRWNDPRGPHSPAEIAFTAAGKRFFDERAVARDLALFVRSPKLAAARRSLKQGGTAPAAAALTRGLPARVVALANRRQLPAAGQIGVWSDRDDTIEVSARSAAGKRLFIELRGGKIGRHNLEGLAFVF